MVPLPKDAYGLIPGTCDETRKHDQEESEVAVWLTPRWGDYPGLPGWPNVITRSLKVEVGMEKRTSEMAV